jgi:hypothetical protein
MISAFSPPELATHAPMMIRVPGLTDQGLRTNAFTEHVDLFPTLTELAVGVTLPRCPEGPQQLETALCTMGKSLVPLLHGALLPEAPANASYMQYPRHAQMMTRSTCLDAPCVMGYSIVTRLDNSTTIEYRYTEWVDFNTQFYRGASAAPTTAAAPAPLPAATYFITSASLSPRRPAGPDFSSNVGLELYDHTNDPGENVNLALGVPPPGVVPQLSRMLRRGPLTGGGWGPWAVSQ